MTKTEAIVPVVLMTKAEAKACAEAIRIGMGDVRTKLVEMYNREGWRALGYSSWRECVVSEFDKSQAYLYRLLAAAKIEEEISPMANLGQIPESHLRPLKKLKKAEERKEVWDELTLDGHDPTAEEVLLATEQKLIEKASASLKSRASDTLADCSPAEKCMVIELREEELIEQQEKAEAQRKHDRTIGDLENMIGDYAKHLNKLTKLNEQFTGRLASLTEAVWESVVLTKDACGKLLQAVKRGGVK